MLTNFSDDQLRDELKRRRDEKKPKQLPTPDFTELGILCNEYIESIHSKGWADDDSKEFIFEAALRAFYGMDIFKWTNEHTL